MLAGVTWNVIGSAFKIVILLGSSIVIARKLTPEEFAVGGIATAIMGFLTILTFQGFSQVLIQRKEIDNTIKHTVFWISFGLSMMIALIIIFLAPTIANFYNTPELVLILKILVLAIVGGALASIPSALLIKALRFKAINFIQVVAALVSSVIGIGLAIYGYGYWAIIIPLVSSQFIFVVGNMIFSRYFPSLKFSLKDFRSTFKFGSSMLGSKLLQYFNDNGDYLILGKYWAPNMFGQYFFSYEKARQPLQLILSQVHSVIFPAFSKIQDDRNKIRQYFIKGTHIFSMLNFPIHVLLIGYANLIIPFVFGEQWMLAIPVFRIFLIRSLLQSFGLLVPGTLMALNKPHVILYFNMLRFVIIIPTLFYLVKINADIATTAMVLVGISYILIPFFYGYLFKLIGLKIGELWNRFWKLLLSAILMGIVIWIINFGANYFGLADYVNLTVGSILAVIIFLIMNKREIANFRTIIKDNISTKK